MKKLQAYERALTLFGKIFSELKNRENRYFFASLKYDFVFFLFALIWEKGGEGFGVGKRFFPRNFNEWRFGKRFILFNDDNPRFWDIDKEYFRQEKIIKRSGKKLAILTRGLDLDRFSLEEFIEKENIRVVIDWKSKKKWQVFLGISFFYFFFQNTAALFKIYKILAKNYQINLSFFDFLRYFIYYAFHSARIRYFIKALCRDNSIGTVIFSDIDNAWGNSFMLWSHFYGFSQIVYTHGSSLYLNQHRYFNPTVYVVYTAYHEKIIKNSGLSSRILTSLPGWVKKDSLACRPVEKEVICNIAFVTGMERNLEVPFTDEEILFDYLENISTFVCKKNLSLLIKSHKLLDWHKEYDDFTKKFQCVRHVKERWSQQDIGQIDLGILAITESTLALQFLHKGIPVITCSELVPQIWTKHFSAPYFQFVAKTKTELLEVITRLLNDKEFYQKSQKEAVSIFNSLIHGFNNNSNL